MKEKLEKLKALLDDQHDWPCNYNFKFIVPKDQVEALKAIIGPAAYREKPSRNGKYISVTANKIVGTSDEVLSVYTIVKKIPGLLAL